MLKRPPIMFEFFTVLQILNNLIFHVSGMYFGLKEGLVGFHFDTMLNRRCASFATVPRQIDWESMKLNNKFIF